MCLSRVTRRVKPTGKTRYGWKVFTGGSYGSLKFEFRRLGRSKRVPRGRWLRAKERPISYRDWDNNGSDSDSSDTYLSGFHFFCEPQGVPDWEICVRVEVRGVHTYGTESMDDERVGVARYMRVPKDSWSSA